MPNLLQNQHGDLYSPGYYQSMKMQFHTWPTAAMSARSLFLRSGFEVERNGSSYFQHNHNPDLAIELVTAGAVVYEDDHCAEKVFPGEIYLVHHNADTIIRTDEGRFYRKKVLCLTGSLLDSIVESLKLVGMRHLKPENPAEFESRIDSLLKQLCCKEHDSESRIAGDVYELLFQLAECFHSKRSAFPAPLLAALDFINSSFQHKISLAQIAYNAGVSQSTLVRLFHRHLGKHPMAWLIDLRLEIAKSMVTATDLPIKEISWRCGYASPYYFSTAFRGKYGCSPREFRTTCLPPG